MKFITIVVLMGFVWLSMASYRHVHPEVGYAPSEIAAVNKLAVYKTRSAAVLADVYGISEAELSKPVRLFGE